MYFIKMILFKINVICFYDNGFLLYYLIFFFYNREFYFFLEISEVLVEYMILGNN